jgi:cytochrome P450
MSTVTDVPIEDPRFYLDDPWPTFEWMQRDAPFWYYEPLDTFVLTRYDDIKAVAGLPHVFVSSRGLFLNDVKFQAQAGDELLTDRFFPKGGEQVGTTDPPRHRELRRVIAPAFTEEALDRLAAPIDRYVAELLDGITPGQVVDWITHARGGLHRILVWRCGGSQLRYGERGRPARGDRLLQRATARLTAVSLDEAENTRFTGASDGHGWA